MFHPCAESVSREAQDREGAKEVGVLCPRCSPRHHIRLSSPAPAQEFSADITVSLRVAVHSLVDQIFHSCCHYFISNGPCKCVMAIPMVHTQLSFFFFALYARIFLSALLFLLGGATKYPSLLQEAASRRGKEANR